MSLRLKPGYYLRGLALIACLVAGGYALKGLGLAGLLDTGWIDAEVRDKGLYGEALFLGLATLAMAVGLPRQMVAFLAGYAFGLVGGTALAVAASVAACVLSFFAARFLARDMVARRFAGRIARFDRFLARHPVAMTLLVRLIPVGNNLLTNLVAGVTRVGPVPFFVGSAVGYLPQTVVFALLGSGVQLDGMVRIGLSAALFAVSGVLGVHLFRRFRGADDLDGDLASVVAERE